MAGGAGERDGGGEEERRIDPPMALIKLFEAEFQISRRAPQRLSTTDAQSNTLS